MNEQKQQNVDLKEIDKFDQMAKDWWDPHGSMQPLHLLNPVRLSYIKEYASLKSMKVLDVGCGGGILTESLAQEGAEVTGIDLSEAALEVARQHASNQQLSIDYQKKPVEELAQTHSQQYDVVTCMEMLEHVPDPVKIIQACGELVKPGGKVFFSTLHRNPKAFLFAIVAAEYILNLLPKGTHQYAKFIKPSELNNWANTAKLQLIDMRGVHYSPFHKTFSLNRDLSVNYLACYEK